MTSAQPGIVVIGSINMDLVARTAHVPAPGETVLGRDFVTIPGGKGANQAVAAARLGARVAMVGRVGEDAFGRRLITGLAVNDVDVTHVRVSPGAASGVAMIVVADNGENAITVASGANFLVTPADVDEAQAALQAARLCLLQLELPLETVAHAIGRCRQLGVEVILDPAPAPSGPLPASLFSADIVSPNESEAAALSGLPGAAAVREVARALTAKGCRTLVLKRGAEGAYLCSPEAELVVPGFAVRAVDTTAAGDAFTAALAVARARKQPMAEAVRFANAAGALACTRRGAQPSMPSLAEVEELLGPAPFQAELT